MLTDYILTAIVPILLCAVVVCSSKRADAGNRFFNKDFTTMLKGVCAIIVIYVHVGARYGNPLQDVIGSFAYVAVTFFFLTSAYGMNVSAERNPSYLTHFWRNRLLSLLVPYAIICMAILLFESLAYNRLHLEFNNYVKTLLEYCLVFYVLWKLSGRLNIYIYIYLAAIVALSSVWLYFCPEYSLLLGGWPYERVGLVWGILLWRFYPVITEWLDRHNAVKTIGFLILSAVLGLAYLKFKSCFFWGEYVLKVVLGLCILVWVFLVTNRRTFINPLTKYLGSISYEIYLIHTLVMDIVMYFMPGLSSGLFILAVIIGSILCASVIHALAMPVVHRYRIK